MGHGSFVFAFLYKPDYLPLQSDPLWVKHLADYGLVDQLKPLPNLGGVNKGLLTKDKGQRTTH